MHSRRYLSLHDGRLSPDLLPLPDEATALAGFPAELIIWRSRVGISFVLFQMICVILVAAYLITRTASFWVLGSLVTWKSQAILILLFGALSIYGTESGITILSATANVRDPPHGRGSRAAVVGLGAG